MTYAAPVSRQRADAITPPDTARRSTASHAAFAESIFTARRELMPTGRFLASADRLRALSTRYRDELATARKGGDD